MLHGRTDGRRDGRTARLVEGREVVDDAQEVVGQLEDDVLDKVLRHLPKMGRRWHDDDDGRRRPG